MKYHHLIWDFDGTLFNTYPPLNRAIRLAAADKGAMVDEPRVARLLTQTLTMCVETLALDFHLEVEDFEKQIAYYRDKTSPEDKPPFEGAIAICRQFKEAGGQNFIFTHRDHASLYELLAWYQVADLFADRLSTEDGFPRKPNPAGFTTLIERHELDPEKTLAIGDRTLDLMAARRAGIASCLFAPEPDALVTSTHYITDFEQLGEILGLG